MKKQVMVAIMAAAMSLFADENPEREFDAAYAAGKIYTAEQAYKIIVAEKPNTAPIRHYQAADIALIMGNGTLRRDRLSHYIRAERGWNENVHKASWELSRIYDDVNGYLRMLGRATTDEWLFSEGIRLGYVMREARRPAVLQQLLAGMYQTFRSDSWVRRMHELNVAMHRQNNLGNFDFKQLDDFIRAYPFKDLNDSYSVCNWLCDVAYGNPKFVFPILLKYRQTGMSETFCRAVDRMGFDKDDKTGPKEFLRDLKTFEPIVFTQQGTPYYREAWSLYWRLNGMRDLDIATSGFKTNEVNAARVRRLEWFGNNLETARKNGGDNWRNHYEGFFTEAIWDCCRFGIFTAQQKAAFYQKWKKYFRDEFCDEAEQKARVAAAEKEKKLNEGVEDWKDEKKGTDALSKLRREANKLNPRELTSIPKLMEIYKQAAAQFPGKLPDPTKSRAVNGNFNFIAERYADAVQYSKNKDDYINWLALAFPKFTKDMSGYIWDRFGCAVWDRGVPNDLARKYRLEAAKIRGDLGYLAYVKFPRATATLPQGFDLEKMNFDQITAFMEQNCGEWGGQLIVSQALMRVAHKYLEFGPECYRRDWYRAFNNLERINQGFKQKGAWDQYDFNKVLNYCDFTDGNGAAVARYMISYARQAKKADALVKKYFESVKKPNFNAIDRVHLITDFLETGDIPAKERGETMLNVWIPAMKAVPETRLCSLGFGRHSAFHHSWNTRQWVFDRAGKDCPEKADCMALTNLYDRAYAALQDELARVFMNRGGGNLGRDFAGGGYARIYNRATKEKKGLERIRVLPHYATSACGNEWFVRDVMSSLKQEENWECLYLVSGFGGWEHNQDFTNQRAKFHSEAATHLPGIYPVGEKDPSYPLYVAADELARKNNERAWELLKKNLLVFEREALKLPPNFVAWGVEQLRLQRGDKDALLIKAREIATQLLANEGKLTAELAAAMLLTRAETYRTQQNFEAARLEYQTVRQNPTYHATKYGRVAMFRAVDLQIDTGDAGSAQQTIEYWLSQPDTEIQAEAHYFLAKIAFDQKDYDECIKQLKEVFAIDLTHTGARFLQGKWKLATGNEVDDTEVLVGGITDRTTLRPGQQLAITVQDRNLSVAGGGQSIPVIVTTAPGGDRELVRLYPSPRDPNVFKGAIDVKLAAPAVSNLVLDVSGEDKVSYVIDPEFLKTRGIKLNAPKVLSVIDDGRLAIGTGAPKEESSNDIEFEGRSLLRPGNPLYIAVMDKDRSTGKPDCSVNVKVKTSSGDVLPAVELKEVKPYTGIFRGKIPSALPPPRAFASDTAAGYNAGDVINRRRDGVWRSVADSKPGKWLEVDTMASHLVSNVTMHLENPDDVSRVRLVGRIGSDTFRLGSLPAEKVTDRVGLGMQWYYPENGRRWMQSADEIRTVCLSPGCPGRTVVTNFTFTPQKFRDARWSEQRQLTMYRGAFMMPAEYETLRLRFKFGQSDAAARSAWLAIAVDGKVHYRGAGKGLATEIVTIPLQPGVHMFEMYVTSLKPTDAFELMFAPSGETPRPFPCDWFDAKEHPEIAEFLADKAVITKTKDGFAAVMPTPVRLRSLRWEFLSVRSPDIVVKDIEVVNDKAEKVIPVDSDFSDAQKNSTLEVAPGDGISVTYIDDRTTSGERRTLARQISSSFNNANVGFMFESFSEEGGRVISRMHRAYRFQPGDTIIVQVDDSDMDISDDADTVEVNIATFSGETKTMKLVEQEDERLEVEGTHTGCFRGLLKTSQLKLDANDMISVSYLDRENTNPGVPFIRQATVRAVAYTKPEITLFRTQTRRVVDDSADAARKLADLRRRPGNEKVSAIYRNVSSAVKLPPEVCASTNPIPCNIRAAIPVRVNSPSLARHESSSLVLEAVAESELKRAEMDGDEPVKVKIPLGLAGNFTMDVGDAAESFDEAMSAGSFNGTLPFAIGMAQPPSDGREWGPNNPKPLEVNGSDKVILSVYDPIDNNKLLMTRTMKFVSDAELALKDSTWTGERTLTHARERFNIEVDDPDRDLSDGPDTLKVKIVTTASKKNEEFVLTETMPHSGLFRGIWKLDDSVKYGDNVIVSYADEFTVTGTTARTLCTTGMVLKGANATIRMFSKRFRDEDEAVLVQFRIAECLFEQAKEFRKLKNKDKSAESIAEGKRILEEALKAHPDSSHVARGEYLLANLYFELAMEQKELKNKEESRRLFGEALARFSQFLAIWPDGELGAKAQFHKALVLEMLEDYRTAGEEYVKMTYIYPESELVGDATIRLATYYYRNEKRYDIAGKIYENFQKRFPSHDKAARALFMCGSCYVKQADTIVKKAKEELQKQIDRAKAAGKKPPSFNNMGVPSSAVVFYMRAIDIFTKLPEQYASAPAVLKAQALYWGGDSAIKANEQKKAYLLLNRTILEFPETEWARRARGLLVTNGKFFKGVTD